MSMPAAILTILIHSNISSFPRLSKSCKVEKKLQSNRELFAEMACLGPFVSFFGTHAAEDSL